MNNLIRVFFFLALNMGLNIDSHARSNLIFSDSFEEGSLDGREREVCVSCSHAINIVNSQARSGERSSRFELRRNDPDSSVGSKRAELAHGEIKRGKKQERWYGFSLFLPESYEFDTAKEIVTQWHAVPDGYLEGNQVEKWRSPPLSLFTSDGNWGIRVHWDTNKISVGKPQVFTKLFDSYQKGKWTDWVFHVKWSYEEDGVLEIWKNGIKVLSRSGPIGFNDDAGPVMKTGIYKWLWQDPPYVPYVESIVTKRILYADEIYIGNKNAGYSDVSPAIENTPHTINDDYILPNNEWRLISLFSAPPSHDNTALQLFSDELGDGYGSRWIMFSYDPQRNSYIELGSNDTLSQGIGYWIVQLTGVPVTLNLSSANSITPVVLSSQCISAKGCYEIALASAVDGSQWNLLGYPFSRGNDISRVRVVTNGGLCKNGCSLDSAKDENIFHNRLWSYDEKQLPAFLPWNGFWGLTLQGADNLEPKLLIPVD